MGILLSRLMKMPCFKNAKLVAGTVENKNTYVEGITIIERPDIANWIKGGELLLSSFYSIDKNIEAQKILVTELAEKKAAALIIKTSRFLTTIPDEIIDLGNQLDFPIIEISGDTKYIDITYPVMGEIFNDQVNRLNYYKDCHEKFTKLSLKMKGISAVAETLGDLVENPVIILNNELTPIAWNDPKYKDIDIIDDNIKGLVEKDYPVYGLKMKIPNTNDTIYTMIIEPIQVLNEIRGYLGVLEKNRIMEELDFIALESAATTLKLEMLKDVAVTEVELKYKGDLMDDLINERIDSIQSIYDRGNLFGWNLKRSFIVTLLNISQYEKYINNKKNLTEGLHLLMDKIKKRIDRVSYYYTTDYISINKGDYIIMLWPIEKGANLRSSYNAIKEFGQELKRVILDEIGNIEVSIGIGGLAENPLEIGKSYSEAKDAVNFGYRIFGKDFITTFEELGIYKLLCRYENRDDLKKFVHPSLWILKEYDKDKNNELIDTLEKYLHCNLNAVKTAEELFVHYKTVLYRLNRIKELTNLDIENRANMLEIEVGLKILRIIN
ncbi:PucR family transcriptional regulator ligand-binding domain-containing protein [Tissierella carlieri]|uniref:PucR family transcriptional regulator ligand-binding domain-containing protein n=1 Tax=Tissierella carlieri TaxID=689904 RepID=A0ABT1S9G7_9FIRM|nr:PucR family transcriptional regulator ligand-binding domain-containing protein [Tissierella carlieri]MCQ4923099.1 PucR family transcriptional regulator ligand-binding domain-containing protein [Tissierella carlieri]